MFEIMSYNDCNGKKAKNKYFIKSGGGIRALRNPATDFLNKVPIPPVFTGR